MLIDALNSSDTGSIVASGKGYRVGVNGGRKCNLFPHTLLCCLNIYYVHLQDYKNNVKKQPQQPKKRREFETVLGRKQHEDMFGCCTG